MRTKVISTRKKLKSLRKLEADLWTVFSKWVRLSNSSINGNVDCFTCGKLMHWKEADAGHYISRSHKALKFDRRNVRPQCFRCNRMLRGNQDEFAVRLQIVYGEGILQELNKLKWQEKRFTRIELTTQIDFYKGLIKDLEK